MSGGGRALRRAASHYYRLLGAMAGRADWRIELASVQILLGRRGAERGTRVGVVGRVTGVRACVMVCGRLCLWKRDQCNA